MLRAVGKYNRTEAPIVLQTARKALCLSEAAGEQVHAAVYDAQLALLLDDEKSSLSEDDMELLGELEGMLQVRGASAALRRRTEPLFQAMASDALTAAFSGAGKSAIATGLARRAPAGAAAYRDGKGGANLRVRSSLQRCSRRRRRLRRRAILRRRWMRLARSSSTRPSSANCYPLRGLASLACRRMGWRSGI